MKFAQKLTPALIAVICAGLLAACNYEQKPDDASQAAAPATPAPVVNDPDAINTPIAPESFKTVLSLTGKPTVSEDGKTLSFNVRVKNEGAAPVYGVGAMPVNVGAMILGAGGSVDVAGGVRDFVRAPLPLIPAGHAGEVNVVIPADSRLNGKSLRFATVQESIAWHDADGTVDAGPFVVLDSKFDASAIK